MHCEPFQPVSKERAAEILQISKRTIDNMIADGTLPQPVPIGRRVYWHPDIFFACLNQKLTGTAHTTNASLANEQPERRRGRPRKELQ